MSTALDRLDVAAEPAGVTSPCKTRPECWRRGLLVLSLLVSSLSPLNAQQREADRAWAAGSYAVARAGYQQVLATNPSSARANLRLGILLSWEGKLDSSLVHLARARAAEPADLDIR